MRFRRGSGQQHMFLTSLSTFTGNFSRTVSGSCKIHGLGKTSHQIWLISSLNACEQFRKECAICKWCGVNCNTLCKWASAWTTVRYSGKSYGLPLMALIMSFYKNSKYSYLFTWHIIIMIINNYKNYTSRPPSWCTVSGIDGRRRLFKFYRRHADPTVKHVLWLTVSHPLHHLYETYYYRRQIAVPIYRPRRDEYLG